MEANTMSFITLKYLSFDVLFAFENKKKNDQNKIIGLNNHIESKMKDLKFNSTKNNKKASIKMNNKDILKTLL
jgi:hypothetical protein